MRTVPEDLDGRVGLLGVGEGEGEVEGEQEGPGGEVLGVEVVEQGHVHRGGGGAAGAEAQDAAEAHQQRAQVGFEVLWRKGRGGGWKTFVWGEVERRGFKRIR